MILTAEFHRTLRASRGQLVDLLRASKLIERLTFLAVCKTAILGMNELVLPRHHENQRLSHNTFDICVPLCAGSCSV